MLKKIGALLALLMAITGTMLIAPAANAATCYQQTCYGDQVRTTGAGDNYLTLQPHSTYAGGQRYFDGAYICFYGGASVTNTRYEFLEVRGSGGALKFKTSLPNHSKSCGYVSMGPAQIGEGASWLYTGQIVRTLKSDQGFAMCGYVTGGAIGTDANHC